MPPRAKKGARQAARPRNASTKQPSTRKAAPKAAWASPAKRAKTSYGHVVAASSPDDTQQAMPRARPGRRAEEDVAYRATKLKLLDQCYEPELVRTARGESGETIHDLVAKENAASRGKGKCLKTSFWMAIHQSFDLRRAVFKVLPEVPEDHDFDQELTDALVIAHSPNPAERTAEAFARYLDSAPAPN